MKLLKKILTFRPLFWLYVVYDYERKITAEKRKKVEWEGSNDFIQNIRCKSWFADNGEDTLRLNYPLHEKSIVFDVGGYKGEFASALMNKYDCIVHTFEPIPEFYSSIENKFSNNKKLFSHRFGLSNKTSKQKIALLDNSSSVFANGKETVEIQLKSVLEFMDEQGINNIDLIKINIEGGEYDLLEVLLENNKIRCFRNIQIQFHDFVIPNAKERMNSIQNALSKTHTITYQYEFVWENWTLKERD